MEAGIFWFFIILVGMTVFAVMFGGLPKRWLDLKEKQLDNAASLAADRAVKQTAQVEQLEQRMRVLERIVTDRGLAVAEEIDRLRDHRGIEDLRQEEAR